MSQREIKAWDQQPGEGARAFAAFKAYLAMGEKRAIRQLRRKLGKSKTIIERWSSHWKWQERLRAWIAHQQEVEQAALDEAARKEAAEWARREGQVRERRWKIANALLDKADAMLQFPVAVTRSADGKTIVEPGEWNFGQAARIVEVGDKLAALATGQATENTQLTGKDGAPLVPVGAGVVNVYLPEKDKPAEDGD